MTRKSNYQFLETQWPVIHRNARRVEEEALNDPRAANFYARRTIEIAAEWLYTHDQTLTRPRRNNLAAMLSEDCFKDLLPPGLWPKLDLIRKTGNQAVHETGRVSKNDSLQMARELFHFLYWLARTYTIDTIEDPAPLQALNFDANLLPDDTRRKERTRAEIQKLIEEVEKLVEREEATKILNVQLDIAIAKLTAAKAKNAALPDKHDYNEDQTRKYIIDKYLRENGWDVNNPESVGIETPVTGMPRRDGDGTGNGYVDYVLRGKDGLPLGVVEAKRTIHDPRVGQQQAKNYADCLENMTGRRPIIFYTNGYQTYIWDDLNYPPRLIQGFYKADELELIIQRRETRRELSNLEPEEKIVNRHYQKTAIKRICEEFEDKNRRSALVVMATGTGKTRTIIALFELLRRANLVKRVLFLADRRSLVKQAVKAFKANLPDASPVNMVVGSKEDKQSMEADKARVYVSTYQTMVGLIDEARGEERRFGVGYFDLVIVDEAHRSIFRKYKSIFEYFDSLLVGLTATPRSEIDKNTFSLFEQEEDVPTFEYGLSEAVSDKFLVPPRAVAVDLAVQRDGKKYADLSKEEKAEWDDQEWPTDDGAPPEEVDSNAINKWLFSHQTVDEALKYLMEKGQKVNENDRLAKTIIFAKNVKHAYLIQDRFEKHYPKYKGNFAKVIENKTAHAQQLIDNFSDAQKLPQVAISVDMLDTGIDVPAVANLVFFKIIRSKIKFFQMLGRGTRLCPDLFGPERDKENFFVFDFCGNLDYFDVNPEGTLGALSIPLRQKLFMRRTEILNAIDREREINADALTQDGDETKIVQLRKDLADSLHSQIAALNMDNFFVRPRLEHVEKYAQRENWEKLDNQAYTEVLQNLSDLPEETEQDDIDARRFDLLMYNLQVNVLNGEGNRTRLINRVVDIAAKLEEKERVDDVKEHMELILELQREEYWTDITVTMLEEVRKRLRSLLKILDKKERRDVIIKNMRETLLDDREVEIQAFGKTGTVTEYTRKIMGYLDGHADHTALYKLRHNYQITTHDLGSLEELMFENGEITREEFAEKFGEPEQLGEFIRKLRGLERGAAKMAFSQYLNGKNMTADQINFINEIINHLTQNGVMEPERLYEQPFTRFDTDGLDGVFNDKQADGIVEVIRTINQNAFVAS